MLEPQTDVAYLSMTRAKRGVLGDGFQKDAKFAPHGRIGLLTSFGLAIGGWWHRLLDGDGIGCRECVLEGIVERQFPTFAFLANLLVLNRFTFASKHIGSPP